ncbi:hypothetical protein AGMMS49579_06310 [Spirochaetia bacterium]|nr:hypothetical protein AGMMS49579_06310 [Spirochaetia bacterium]
MEMSPQGIAKLAAEIYIEPDLRAGMVLYKGRLAACSLCGDLREGIICAHCGCFVQFRARTVKGYCPHPDGDKWPVGIGA